MGLEANCILRLGRETFAGKAHLDSGKLTFRGEAKLDLALMSISAAAVGEGGALTLSHPAGLATLELSDRGTAEKWAQKIRSPRSLIDNLGLKPNSRVAVLGVADAEFHAQARQRLGAAPETKLRAGLDFILYAADSDAALAKLKSFKKHLRPAGAVWVVSLKGKAAKIRDVDVMRAARAAGLVDNKVCSFSATHTALKLVIPVAER
ncbi:MAG: DUF3052 family protein [Opitutae bacterium]|nr:DUF3052 family protein [Opitutae bacterium]